MINGETFEGVMLTHTKPKKDYDNIELKEEHFEKENERGEKYHFQFDKTYFVKTKLLKEAQWGPFKQVGKLTKEGVDYLESYLKELKPINWHHYLGEEEDL